MTKLRKVVFPDDDVAAAVISLALTTPPTVDILVTAPPGVIIIPVGSG